MTETCANCGHEKEEHYKRNVYHRVGNASVRISKCKKFKPQNWTSVKTKKKKYYVDREKFQNHSPQTRPYKLETEEEHSASEDTPEENPKSVGMGNTPSGTQNQDDNLSKKREWLFDLMLKECPTKAGRIYRIVKQQDREAVKKLKETFKLNNSLTKSQLYYEIDEIFGDDLI